MGFRVTTDMGEAAENRSVGSFGRGGALGTSFVIDPSEELVAIFRSADAGNTDSSHGHPSILAVSGDPARFGGAMLFGLNRDSAGRIVRTTAIRLRTETVGRCVLAEPLNRLSAHRDGFALPSESLKRMAVLCGLPMKNQSGPFRQSASIKQGIDEADAIHGLPDRSAQATPSVC